MANKRQQIVGGIADRLALITTAEGYDTDIGVDVYPWCLSQLADIQPPCITFRDLAAAVTVATVGRLNHALNVEIKAYITGDDPATEARKALVDIVQAVGVDYTWDGLAVSTLLTSHEISLEQTTITVGVAKVLLTITYQTDYWEV